MFSGCTVAHNSKENRLGSYNQEASPSGCKNARVVLLPCCAWKCVPWALCSGVDISEVWGCHLLRQVSSQLGSQKVTSRIGVSWTNSIPFVFDPFLTQWIVAISKECKPDNFESNSSPKLSFTNIQRLFFEFYWKWTFPWITLSWHSCSIWVKLGWLSWFWQFFCDELSMELSRILGQHPEEQEKDT